MFIFFLFQVNIPIHVQKWDFQVLDNDGHTMTGTSVGDLQEPLNVVVSRTRKYVVVLISFDDIKLDKILKEAQYVTDHISSEGY